MQYHLKDKTLRTNTGQVIKQLACPYPPETVRLVWHNAEQVRCHGCNKKLWLAHTQSEAHLLQLVAEQPDVCLLVDFQAPQIQVIPEENAHDSPPPQTR